MTSRAARERSQRSVPDHFDTFELSIERMGEHYRAQVIQSPVGPRSPVTVDGRALEPDAPASEENAGAVRDVRRRPVDRQDLRRLGERLFRSVFIETIAEAFRASVERVRSEGAGLRIRLRLNRAPELAPLPWEALWDPSDRAFLADQADLPVVRSLEVAAGAPTIRPTEPPMRLLALLPDPRGEGKLGGAEEWRHILDQLSPWIEGGLITAECVEPSTLDELGRRTNDGSCQVLHVVAHGMSGDAGSSGVLMLEDAAGGSDAVTGGDFARALERETPPRLVVLNACHGARAAIDDAFDGMAQHLLSRGVPAVVAMRTTISDAAAVSFATALYGALAKGLTIEGAMVEARRRLSLGQHRTEWATPVLYSRAKNVRILAPGSIWPKISAKQRRRQQLSGIAAGFLAAVLAFVLIWWWLPKEESPCPPPAGLHDLQFIEIEPDFIDLEDRNLTIADAFCIGTKEVSRRDWLTVMGGELPRPDWPLEWPMTDVTIEDAHAFTEQLQERQPGASYRLPTAAEWEFAARAKATTAYFFGDDTSRLHKFGNCNNFLSRDGHDGPAPIGSYEPNTSGLYDVHGNVAEWVLWPGEDGPTLTDESGEKALRLGGSFDNAPMSCTFEGSRSEVKANTSSRQDTGFRVARDLGTSINIEDN